MKVRLKHYSHRRGAEGVPGDVVDVTPEVAATWKRARACEYVDASPAAAAEADESPEGDQPPADKKRPPKKTEKKTQK